MNSGWMSQAHSHAQAAATSLDGDEWANKRTAIANAKTEVPLNMKPNVLHSAQTATAINHTEPEEIFSASHGDNDTSDEEMESVHPGYGSVGVSGCYPDLETTRRSVTSNASRPAGIPGCEESPLITERMRSRLRYYFMNPLEKWETKRQFPYKLTIQLVKIILVTFQLILFGTYRYASVNYTYDNRITFSHLFIKDWDSGREITSYPSNMGPLAVYTKDDFYDYVDFTVNAYYAVRNTSIGPYHYHKDKDGNPYPLRVTVVEYVAAAILQENETYVFDTTTVTRSIDVPFSKGSFSSQLFFDSNNFTINFVTLLEMDMTFSLRTIRFRDLGPLKSPDCFSFDILISFLNLDHDGQVLVSLDSSATKFLCKGNNKVSINQAEKFARSFMNYSVIAICALSLFLCCRAIYRAQQLKSEAVLFFRNYFTKELIVQERLNFLNGWYILIICNDILIIIGSAVKEQIENKELQSDAWNICSTCLGIGNLLVWFGVLRYLGFFRTYNVLILTLKRASPNVFRFLLCAVLIYAGFTFCGWLILGPYHMKFSSLSTSSECLFALINGDDMFATFAAMTNKSAFLWWFCRIYLYTFISLFIYVVLSLFIALIMDAYETIKLYYTDGFPRSFLEEFIIGPNDLGSNSGSSSPLHNTTIASHNIQGCHHLQTAAGRKISAAGVLDTILENICGCSTPNPQTSKESISRQMSVRSTESDPLINV